MIAVRARVAVLLLLFLVDPSAPLLTPRLSICGISAAPSLLCRQPRRSCVHPLSSVDKPQKNDGSNKASISTANRTSYNEDAILQLIRKHNPPFPDVDNNDDDVRVDTVSSPSSSSPSSPCHHPPTSSLATKLNKALSANTGLCASPPSTSKLPDVITSVSSTITGQALFHSFSKKLSAGESEAFLELARLGALHGGPVQERPASKTHPNASAVLKEMGRKATPKAAFRLLVALNLWTPYESLPLLRSSFPPFFSPAETAHNPSTPKDPDAALGLRADLRHLKTYTIDTAGASEIDDALTLEVLPTPPDTRPIYRVWIHIADADYHSSPASLVAARRRKTSLYLPSKVVQMFPSRVSDSMSLTPYRDSRALSLSCLLDPDTGKIKKDTITVTPSLIRVDYKLTYADVDEMLDYGVAYGEEFQIGLLLGLARLRRRYRISNGSTESLIRSPLKQGTPVVRQDRLSPGGYAVSVSVEETGVRVEGGRLLVQEMMILSGEAVAAWSDGKLELLHRSQRAPSHMERPSEVATLDSLKALGHDLPAAWYERRFFSPAVVDTKGGRHAGLGVEGYVQWSSPIRRYSDLQVHMSIKRYLRRQAVEALLEAGKPIPPSVTSADLGVPMTGLSDYEENPHTDIDWSSSDNKLRESRDIQKSENTFWILEYIRRRREEGKKVWDATVLGYIGQDNFAVYLEEIGWETGFKSDGLRGVDVGEKFGVWVEDVDPREGKLVLREWRGERQ